MMTKKASPKSVLYRYTLTAPLLVFCLLIFSCESQKSEILPSETQKVAKQTDENSDELVDMKKLDQIPLMSTTCAHEADPEKCSNKLLLEHIYNNVKYPKETSKAGLEGTVVISFVISKTGKVNDIKIVKSLDKYTDEAAITVANSLPKWKPAMKDGKPVAVKFKLPIAFRLK